MVISYIKHLLLSGNAHAINSPFVYELYTKAILSSKAPFPKFLKIEDLRDELKKNHTEIEILDLGAGSRKNKTNRRKISEIARNAEKPAKFGRLFYRLTRNVKPAIILELGTSLGLTTAYFAIAAPEAQIITFEGCPETARLANENFARLGVSNIKIIVGNIDDTLPAELKKIGKEVDLVFFDANHRLEPTVRYFELARQYASPTAIFIFDDIYWSDEMREAWDTIIARPEVTVSIDLFWVGVVFFRKEQVKENFVLRL